MKVSFTKEEMLETANALYEYNAGRRGSDDYDAPDPRELGKLIDKAILIIQILAVGQKRTEKITPKNFCDL